MKFLNSKLIFYSLPIILLVGIFSCHKYENISVGYVTGPRSVCYEEKGVQYSVENNSAADYILWTVPEQAQIISGQGTPKISVNFGRVAGKICVSFYSKGEVKSIDSCIDVTFDVSHHWCREIDFGGGLRASGIAFSIGNKGYYGTGYGTSNIQYNDIWEFDPAINTWTQKALFNGEPRFAAVGFSIGNKGYVGTGYNASKKFKDFWQYDPALNKWTLLDSVPGLPRKYAFGFSIGNKGYIGSGVSENGSILQSDFYEYDPATAHWVSKADVIEKRESGVGFSIGSKGYLGMGRDATGSNSNKFWEFDPSDSSNGLDINNNPLGKWTQKSVPATLTGRYVSVGFSIGNKGYIGTGFDGNNYLKDFWEYDPTTNSWLQQPDFGGEGRGYAVGFSIGSKGYIGTGANNGLNPLSDFWVFAL